MLNTLHTSRVAILNTCLCNIYLLLSFSSFITFKSISPPPTRVSPHLAYPSSLTGVFFICYRFLLKLLLFIGSSSFLARFVLGVAGAPTHTHTHTPTVVRTHRQTDIYKYTSLYKAANRRKSRDLSFACLLPLPFQLFVAKLPFLVPLRALPLLFCDFTYYIHIHTYIVGMCSCSYIVFSKRIRNEGFGFCVQKFLLLLLPCCLVALRCRFLSATPKRSTCVTSTPAHTHTLTRIHLHIH